MTATLLYLYFVKNDFPLRVVFSRGYLLVVVLVYQLAQLLRIDFHVVAHLLRNLPQHSEPGLVVRIAGVTHDRINITALH